MACKALEKPQRASNRILQQLVFQRRDAVSYTRSSFNHSLLQKEKWIPTNQEWIVIREPLHSEFVQRNYRLFKALNPGLPIYVRPCEGVEPHVAARYDRGVYNVKQTSGMSSDSVLDVVRQLEEIAPTINVQKGFRGFGGKPKLAEVI